MKNTKSISTNANASFGKKALVVAAALSFALTGGVVLTAKRAIALDATYATAQQAAWNWTTVASAADAASAVGLARFGLPAGIALGDLWYENPTYSWAGGVAQATYETGATALVVRKGAVDAHSAPLTDRTEAEFAYKYQLDVDGLHLTLLGATAENATVVTWRDGNVEYGITWQGLGGEEMAMSKDDAVRLARTIRDANAEPQRQQTQQQAPVQQPQQQAPVQQQAQDEQVTPAGLISSGEATNIAITYVAGGNNVSNVGCELSSVSTEPRYVVTFHYDDADYLVKVGARDGSVWYATAIYNDGTTSDVTDVTKDSDTEETTDEQDVTNDTENGMESGDQQQGQQDVTYDENVEVNIEA